MDLDMRKCYNGTYRTMSLIEFVWDSLKEHISESMYSSVPNKRPLFSLVNFLKLFRTSPLPPQCLFGLPFFYYSKYVFAHLYRNWRSWFKHSYIKIWEIKYEKYVKNVRKNIHILLVLVVSHNITSLTMTNSLISCIYFFFSFQPYL